MILKNLLYGVVSGLAEFLPVSSRGHQSLLRNLLGITQRDPLLDLFVHISFFLTVLFSCRHVLDAFRKDYQMLSRRGRVRRSAASISRTYELRMLLTAAIPMLVMLILLGNRNDPTSLWLGVYFVINGIILFVPDYLLQSNKDAGKMVGLDGLLMGISYGLSIIPGISAIGAGLSVSIARGADKSHAYNWMLLLTLPAAIVLCFFDVIAIFTAAKITRAMSIFDTAGRISSFLRGKIASTFPFFLSSSSLKGKGYSLIFLANLIRVLSTISPSGPKSLYHLPITFHPPFP